MNEENELRFSAGTILHLEQGEYSDRCIAGLLVCRSDLNLTKLAHEWFEKEAQSWATKAKDGGSDWAWLEVSGFVGWLCAEQHCAALSHQLLRAQWRGSRSTMYLVVAATQIEGFSWALGHLINVSCVYDMPG